MELDHPWFVEQPRCHAHLETPAQAVCPRCGTFCCAGCLPAGGLCEPCSSHARVDGQHREALSIALKLAIGPGLVAVASLWSLAHQRPVPWVFGIWLMPMVCAFALVRTERPSVAWLGAATSVLLLLWLAAGLSWAGEYGRLTDVVMLSIAPLVALPGCVRLSRLADRRRFALKP